MFQTQVRAEGSICPTWDMALSLAHQRGNGCVNMETGERGQGLPAPFHVRTPNRAPTWLERHTEVACIQGFQAQDDRIRAQGGNSMRQTQLSEVAMVVWAC
jgi:hypothetical protein